MKTLKNKLTYIFLLSMLACSESKPKEDSAMVVDSQPENMSTKQDTSNLIEIATNENSEEANGSETDNAGTSDVEETIEAGKQIIEAGKELMDEKRKNDSIRLSKREKMFAYQLGLPIENEKLVIEAYEKLSDIQGVYALKKSRNEYILIKYEDKDEEKMDEELTDYKSQHATEVIGEIKKIDLIKECGKRKKPVLNGKLKKRKDDTQINCLTCQN